MSRRGAAFYGNRIANLGATITRGVLTLVDNGEAGAAWEAVVQGCAEGARPAGAPTTAGDTVTITVPAGGSVDTDLPAGILADLADGTSKGLVLVGSDRGGTHGTAEPPGWALALDYEME